jgi:hypothetical protein
MTNGLIAILSVSSSVVVFAYPDVFHRSAVEYLVCLRVSSLREP